MADTWHVLGVNLAEALHVSGSAPSQHALEELSCSLPGAVFYPGHCCTKAELPHFARVWYLPYLQPNI
jgi:hypothetical protein